MSEDKRIKLLEQFLVAYERLLDSALPPDQKIEHAETLYLAFCAAIGKKPNYSILRQVEEWRG